MVSKRRDGVYQLVNSEEKAMVATTEDHNLWHRRLGHLNRKGMKILRANKSSGLDNIPVSERTCETCVSGKHCKQPFEYSHKRAKNVLDLVHSDLCGPMSVSSVGGAKYFLTFIDDHSRKIYYIFSKIKARY